MSYQLRQMFLAIRGNLTATFATLTTMILTLLILGAVSLLTLNLNKTLSSLESEVQVSAFLLDSAATPDLLSTLQSKAFPEISSVLLVTKEQIRKEMAKDLPSILEGSGLESNPFPNTLRIRLVAAENAAQVAARVKKLPGVESVEYGAGYVENAVKIISSVRYLGYGLVLILLLNSLFNILNTVRIAMYARRQEIEVMRLLGAKRSFIRAPYLLEGMFLGILAGGVSAAALYPGYFALVKELGQFLPALPLLNNAKQVWIILGILLGIGVSMGVFGSAFAANRYLRELE
jgi:cell division transport system permease protein